jgi:hypothetical protein
MNRNKRRGPPANRTFVPPTAKSRKSTTTPSLTCEQRAITPEGTQQNERNTSDDDRDTTTEQDTPMQDSPQAQRPESPQAENDNDSATTIEPVETGDVQPEGT